ncbi:DUF192 domain-containing protein [Candidatus Woesearchaeota archaeon]|nr:DUF192 domain-containing protein [Candidatus Woesearchaeota archaeon]
MIANKTRKREISKEHKLCTSAASKSFGLMFRINPKSLVFAFDKEKIIPLHMFFVFFPIDVLFLDRRKRVVEVKKNFMPFTFYKPRRKAMYVVELPFGAVERTKTRLGDIIDF